MLFIVINKNCIICQQESQSYYEEEKVAHAHTADALKRCEKRLRDCFKQIDALQMNLERVRNFESFFCFLFVLLYTYKWVSDWVYVRRASLACLYFQQQVGKPQRFI